MKPIFAMFSLLFIVSIACSLTISADQGRSATQVAPATQVVSEIQVVPVTQIVPVTQAIPQLVSVTFDISASMGWQDTRAYIQSGRIFRVEYVSGQIEDSTIAIPDGRGSSYVCGNSGCCEPMPYEPRSSLIGKVGNEIFFIGNGGYFTSNSNGTLQLRVNDCDAGLYDNSGSLRVEITP